MIQIMAYELRPHGKGFYLMARDFIKGVHKQDQFNFTKTVAQ